MKKKIFTILFALVAGIGFSWAQTEVLLTTITLGSSSTPSANPEGVATVSAVGVNSRSAMYGWVIYDDGSITIEAQNGYTITRCVFRQNAKEPITVSAAPFAIHWVHGSCVENNRDRLDGVTSVEVYGYAPEPATVAVTGVTLSQSEAAMTVGGDAVTLTATVAPDDATDKTVVWTSSDPSVATVDNGVVTAVAAGTATITATATNGNDDPADDKTATCTVTVTAPEPTPTPTLLITINSDENTDFVDDSETFGNIAVVTFDHIVRNDGDEYGWYMNHENATISVTAVEGYTITSCKFYCAEGNAEDTQAPFEAKLYGFGVVPQHTEVNGNSIGSVGVTKIEVYGYQNSASEPEPTGVENVQTNHVQTTKFFRDGQLLIEKNGKFYNVQGVEVK